MNDMIKTVKVELPNKAFKRWQKIIDNENIAHAIYFFGTDPLQDYINYEVLAGLNNDKFRDEYCEDDAVLSFAKFCFQDKYNLQLPTEEEDKTSSLRRMIFIDLLKAFLIFPNHIENMVSLYKIYGIVRIHSGLKLYTECSEALKKAYLLPLDDDDYIIETTSLPKINNLLETRIYKNFKNDKNPLIKSFMYDWRTFDEIVKYIIKLE